MGEPLGKGHCRGVGHYDFQVTKEVGTEVGSEDSGLDRALIPVLSQRQAAQQADSTVNASPVRAAPSLVLTSRARWPASLRTVRRGCHCPEGTFQHRVACIQVRTQLGKSLRVGPRCP